MAPRVNTKWIGRRHRRGLPQPANPPLTDPRLVSLRNALVADPNAHVLAGPIRECHLTRRHLPAGFLARFRLAQNVPPPPDRTGNDPATCLNTPPASIIEDSGPIWLAFQSPLTPTKNGRSIYTLTHVNFIREMKSKVIKPMTTPCYTRSDLPNYVFRMLSLQLVAQLTWFWQARQCNFRRLSSTDSSNSPSPATSGPPSTTPARMPAPPISTEPAPAPTYLVTPRSFSKKWVPQELLYAKHPAVYWLRHPPTETPATITTAEWDAPSSAMRLQCVLAFPSEYLQPESEITSTIDTISPTQPSTPNPVDASNNTHSSFPLPESFLSDYKSCLVPKPNAPNVYLGDIAISTARPQASADLHPKGGSLPLVPIPCYNTASLFAPPLLQQCLAMLLDLTYLPQTTDPPSANCLWDRDALAAVGLHVAQPAGMKGETPLVLLGVLATPWTAQICSTLLRIRHYYHGNVGR
ncbi:hypothetical protein H4R33_000522 [Dimargaris cristalligena]|uniref:Uncharacterized protein n=1 Tax=Dimargaris cristalligena TaxID=215637 RepID=A0A4P9ZQN6_9FUNG|nr:hypothetical protein H4R33_000522 [Dimargaris cristalligena]RKP34952.1 hypothetical protein BJ085DRAFT_40518 [Dimargaris cristalligena]|eukprot:RKP34952.1 hypothetical protein BJ085DRAFT_40518 [Dimargaris cristalligena]